MDAHGPGGVALMGDPRPDDVRRALERVVLRWGRLPLDRAEDLVVAVRDCAARCAAVDPQSIPDLGPATAADQLAVAVFDGCSSGRAEHLTPWLTDLLARLS